MYKHDRHVQSYYACFVLLRGFFHFGSLIWGINSPHSVLPFWIFLSCTFLLAIVIIRPFFMMKDNIIQFGSELLNLIFYC